MNPQPSSLLLATALALTGFALTTLATAAAFAQAATAESTDLTSLARAAVADDPAAAASAIKALRAAGPNGLQALMDANASLIAAHVQPNAGRPGSPTAFHFDPRTFSAMGRGAIGSSSVPAADDDGELWVRLQAALDAVGQQRDCATSGLYWYTDLGQAEAAARASGKPILSLRLLGNLCDEYSCANSRFFRTTLYSNAKVSRYLRENFVLHWQSERPVPRITIDFGDGRRIERTITGNSIHYILDSSGRPVDALPGLYGPAAFMAGLTRAAAVVHNLANLPPHTTWQTALQDYHSQQLADIQARWAADLQKVTPGAAQPPPDLGGLEEATSDSQWAAIARLHAGDSQLDAASLLLISAKQPPTAAQAGAVSVTKAVAENPLVKMVRNLEQSIAEDTVRNEYRLHARIHEWFVSGRIIGPANGGLAWLNSMVYNQLFLTPENDPWLGLAQPDVFSALDHGGLVVGAARP